MTFQDFKYLHAVFTNNLFMKNLSKFYPHFLAIIGFMLVSLVYFYPVLQGKKISQSDIAQYTGMAKEMNDYRKATGEETYWTNSAFGGMPTYQMGADYPHNYIKKLDSVIRFLPRPADYLFLYFLGFYILLTVLKTNPLKAFFGALAFGFSTYLVIILGAGHNSKAHAIAYMPLVIAGILLVFRKRYIVGGLLTVIAAALEISANHFQMTYYLLFLVLIICLYKTVRTIFKKDYRHLGISAGIFAIAGLLAIGLNATNLMATSELADFTIRGKSELTTDPEGKPKDNTASMDYSYITEYSYGKAESFNLIAPRLFGGGGSENVGKDSHMYEYVIGLGATSTQAEDFAEHVPTYWGDQPIVEAPAYIGAVVFFLAILALFIDKRKIKYAFLAGAILSLMLSWGKNFPVLTDFFIYNVPLYDKFRAVSSIQVILELCIPVLAFMGVQSYFNEEKEKQFKALWQSAAACLIIVIVLFFVKGSFDFAGIKDSQYDEMFGKLPGFIDALKEQRRQMYSADLWRTAILIVLSAGVLFAFNKKKLSAVVATVIVGVLAVGDLFFIDKNYVNSTDFVNAREVDVPFEATPADQFILEDTTDFRVYEVQGRLAGRTSYFHKAVGGYSAVRPRRLDELFAYQVENKLGGLFNTIDQQRMALGTSLPVLDMLNIKYLLLQAGDGQSVPITNPHANGPAWFVANVKVVGSADEEMKALSNVNTKKTAIVLGEFDKTGAPSSLKVDSLAQIQLIDYKPGYAKYKSQNSNLGVAIFSEMYYEHGWNAYVDGKLAPHFLANYVLRAMTVPAGKHTIEFKFEPEVVKTGSSIALISSIAVFLLFAAAIYMEWKKSKQHADVK